MAGDGRMSYTDFRRGGLPPKGRPRVRGKKAPGRETVLVYSVLKLLAIHPKVAWAVRMNSGAIKVDKRFVRFAFKGCSDIVGMLKDGRFLALEVKTELGRVTPEQAAFLETVRRNNGLSAVVRSVDDADKVLLQAQLSTYLPTP